MKAATILAVILALVPSPRPVSHPAISGDDIPVSSNWNRDERRTGASGTTAALTQPGPRSLGAPAAGPTPHLRRGVATWYCCSHGYGSSRYVAAAGPALRVGAWRGRWVHVTAGMRTVRVRLVDWCGCPRGRVIDLHPGPFRALRPLSAGIVAVRVAW